jgi:hypothetical protein
MDEPAEIPLELIKQEGRTLLLKEKQSDLKNY